MGNNNFSKLLISEPPLQVLPSLAKEIGLNEAIVVQQIHYWLIRSEHEHDGKKWIYNSYESWREQFPFWSVRTIRRIIAGLKESGIIKIGNYNKLKIDRTLWYTIDYNKIPCGNAVQANRTSCPNQKDGVSTPLPENSSETTTDINNIDDSTKNQDKENEVLNHNVDIAYLHYPSRCPISKRATGKGSRDKERLRKLIKKIGFRSVEDTIEAYLRNCSATKTYVKNFSTFLNNFPDLEELKASAPPEKETRQAKPMFKEMIERAYGK